MKLSGLAISFAMVAFARAQFGPSPSEDACSKALAYHNYALQVEIAHIFHRQQLLLA